MPSNRKETASQLRSKQVLAVRSLATRVSWLDGKLYWQDGRVSWQQKGQVVFAESRDIARTQRALNKIAAYPEAARQVLGDWKSWLAAKHNRLTLAKLLALLNMPNIHELASMARSKDEQALDKLASLIVVEALCANEMPVSPSAAIVRIGASAASSLKRLSDDTKLPFEARMLAALTLGSICKADKTSAETGRYPAVPSRKEISGAADHVQILRRAYRWGLHHGLPSEPALIVYLLREDSSEKLVDLYNSARVSASHFSNLGRLSRELATDGLPPRTIVSIAEEIALANQIAERLWMQKEKPSARSSDQRQREAKEDLDRREMLVAKFVDVMTNYALCTGAPRAIRAATTFWQRMLDLGPIVPELIDTTVTALSAGTALGADRACAYVELLADKHQILWDPADVPDKIPGREDAMFGSWVFRRWVLYGQALVTLLKSTLDAQVLRQAIDLHIHHFLAKCEWKRAEMITLVVRAIRELELFGELVFKLNNILEHFREVTSARTTLRPLLAAIADLPVEVRSDYLGEVLSIVGQRKKRVKTEIGVLSKALPIIARMKTVDRDNGVCTTMLRIALVLHEHVGELSKDWLLWLAGYRDAAATPRRSSYQIDRSTRTAVILAVTIAGSDFSEFQKVVVACGKCDLEDNDWLFERGVLILKRVPNLHRPIARAVLYQPHRCAGLIVKLGLVGGLGWNAFKTLEALEELWGTDPAIGESWHALLQAPDMSGLISEYCKACELLGQSSVPPDNVQRAFAEPIKLAREIAHLETLHQQQPQRTQLRARLDNLRSYLANHSSMEEHIFRLARDGLLRATIDRQLQAIDKHTTHCFFAQLEDVVGPLPDSLNIDRYLQNAILLSAEITCNRRLLKSLIRASIFGDVHWRERQPGNEAFLAGLAERGVDVKTWLASCPHRYRLPGVPGGSVRLFLETDPLRVLEMGNYFDTCLSMGRENSFATVTNACELNKRVVYAADGKGRIVGRKLIGIEEKGGMVGFRTYTSLPDGESNKALRGIFRRYLSDFAGRCGLSLADEGTVVPIVAKYWYDDGTVGWQEDVDTTSPAPSAAMSPAGRVRDN